MIDKRLKTHIDKKLKGITVNNNLKKTILEQSADVKPVRKFNAKKITLTSAAAILLAVFPITAAASTVPVINDWVYSSVSPQLAEYLYPINESCTDNGIKVEINSAVNDSHNARIFFTVQDVEGKGRLNEDIDLCDTYQLDIGGFSAGTASLESYDSKTQTAKFCANITVDEDLTGKMTSFNLNMIMSNKINHNKFNTGINIGDIISETPQTGGNNFKINGYTTESEPDKKNILKPDVTDISVGDEIDFMTISNIGFIDGKLHIQTKWKPSFDNHGDLLLYDGENRAEYNIVYFRTNEDVNQSSGNSLAKHVEYIFDISPEELNNYKLFAEFTEDGNIIKGNWKVNLRMRSTESIKLNCDSADTAEITSLGMYISGYNKDSMPQVMIKNENGTNYSVENFTIKTQTGIFSKKNNYYADLGWIDIHNISSVTVDGKEVYRK